MALSKNSWRSKGVFCIQCLIIDSSYLSGQKWGFEVYNIGSPLTTIAMESLSRYKSYSVLHKIFLIRRFLGSGKLISMFWPVDRTPSQVTSGLAQGTAKTQSSGPRDKTTGSCRLNQLNSKMRENINVKSTQNQKSAIQYFLKSEVRKFLQNHTASIYYLLFWAVWGIISKLIL